MNEPKILIMDLENAPHNALVWSFYKLDSVAHVIEEGYLLSFAAKWLGKRKTEVYALCDYKGYKKGSDCEKKLAQDLWKYLDEADIVIGHNMDRFDSKKANAAFFKHGLGKPSPYQTVDTLKVARANFLFPSNKLDSLLKKAKIGKKLEHEGIELWVKCMYGDKKAWKTMKRYNKIDVQVSEKLYEYLRPWVKNHPNVAAIAGVHGDNVCDLCLSTNLEKRGLTKPTKSGVRKQRLKCRDCGKWCQGERVQKGGGIVSYS